MGRRGVHLVVTGALAISSCLAACGTDKANRIQALDAKWEVHHTEGAVGLVANIRAEQADRIVSVAVDPPLTARMIGASTREEAGHLGHLDGDTHKDTPVKGLALNAGDNFMKNHGPHIEVGALDELATGPPVAIRVTLTLESGGSVEIEAPVEVPVAPTKG